MMELRTINHNIYNVNLFDAFCRTITFTILPLNVGQMRPK